MAEKQSHEPTTWFAVLRAAREARDRDLETLARRELEALGYRVSITRQRERPREEVSP